MNKCWSWFLLPLAVCAHGTVHAETFTVDQAVSRALATDPRVSELEYLAEAAKTYIAEAEGSGDFLISLNTFVGLAPALSGGMFKSEPCGVGAPCEVRDDRYSLASGFSPWAYIEASVIKPLYTFGKIENFSQAAKSNVKVKEADVRIQRGMTMRDVKRAYFGQLAARDSVAFLQDVQSRVDTAISKANGWLESGDGGVTQSDLYALQAARGLVVGYLAQAQGLQRISLDGLKVLTGVGLAGDFVLADERLVPLPLPQAELASLQASAVIDRPEMTQLDEGLKARRALVAANKSMVKPNVYAGVAGMAAYSPGRDRLKNPYVSDPFNDYGVTPMVGLKWDLAPSVQSAKTAREQAELNALVEKSALAGRGIPFQVAEALNKVQASYSAVKSLEDGAKSARRWMLSSYSDFDAGLEKVDKVVSAFQGYTLAYGEYLKTVFDYNMQVVDLDIATGAYQ